MKEQQCVSLAIEKNQATDHQNGNIKVPVAGQPTDKEPIQAPTAYSNVMF